MGLELGMVVGLVDPGPAILAVARAWVLGPPVGGLVATAAVDWPRRPRLTGTP